MPIQSSGKQKDEHGSNSLDNNNNVLSDISGHHTLHFTALTSAPFFGGTSQSRSGNGNGSADVCGSAPHMMQLVDNVETATRTIDAFYTNGAESISPFNVASNVLRRYAPSEGLIDVSRSHHSWLVVEQGRGKGAGSELSRGAVLDTGAPSIGVHLSRRLLNTNSRRNFHISSPASQGAMIQYYLLECRQTVRSLLQTICALQELSTMPTRTQICVSEDDGVQSNHHSQGIRLISAPLRFLAKPVTITLSRADKHPPAMATTACAEDGEGRHRHFAAIPTTVRCVSSSITPSTIAYPCYGTPILPSPATSLLTSLVVDMDRSFQKESCNTTPSTKTTTSLRRPFEVATSIESAPYLSPMLLWSQTQQHLHLDTTRLTTSTKLPQSTRHVQTVSDDLWSVGVLALEWILGIVDLASDVGGFGAGDAGRPPSLYASLFQLPNIKQRYRNIKALGAAWRRLKGEGRTTDVSPQQTPPAVLRVAKSIATLLSSLPDEEAITGDDDASDNGNTSFRRRHNNPHNDPLHPSQQQSDVIRIFFGIGSRENFSNFVDTIINVCLEWEDKNRWDSFRDLAWGGSDLSSPLVQQHALLSSPATSTPPTVPTTSASASFRKHCLVPYLRVVQRTASAEYGHLNVIEVRQQAMYLEWARLLWGLTLTPNSPLAKTSQTNRVTATSSLDITSFIENAIEKQSESPSCTNNIQATLLEAMQKLLSTYQQQELTSPIHNNDSNKVLQIDDVGEVEDGAVQFVRCLLGGHQVGIGSVSSILSLPHSQSLSSSLQLHFQIDYAQCKQQSSQVSEASVNSNNTHTTTNAASTATAASSGIIILEHLQRRHAVWQLRQVATNGACNVSLLDAFGVKPAPISLLPQCAVAPPVALPDPSVPSSPVSPNAQSRTNKVTTTTTPPSALLSQIALCQQREVEREIRRRRHHGNNSHAPISNNHDGSSGGFLLPAAPTASTDDLAASTTSSSAASSVGAHSPTLRDDTRENTGIVSSSSAISDRSAATHGAPPSRRSTYASARCKSLAAVFSEEPPARPHVLTHIRMLAMDPSVTAKAFGRHLDRIRREEQQELERAFEKFCAGPLNTQRSNTANTNTASSPLLPAYFQRAILWSAGTASPSTSSSSAPQSRALRVPLVPTTLRSICWAKLLGVPACGAGRHAAVDDPYYAINTYKPSGSDRQIAVDIPRCHQYHHLLSSVEGHRRLTRILKGWLYDVERESDFVYWQGVDSVAAVLLTTNFEDEALACASLRRVVDTYVPHYFNKIANTMDQRLVTFQHVLKYVDPEVALHLEQISCRPEFYGISWFLTLFAHVLPIEKVLLLWDAMFKAGHASFPVCIAVGIISQLREEIGNREFSEVVALLSTGSVQGVLNVAVAAEDASVLFARIPPSIMSPRFEGSYGTLVTSSTCAMIEVRDLVEAFNTRCDSAGDHGANCGGAGELWASTGVFLIDLRLDEERVRGAIKWAGGGGSTRRGGSVISTSSMTSTTTSTAPHTRIGVGASSGGVGLVDDFVYIDNHVTPSSSTTNLIPDHNDEDDEEQGPREVILGALHCPYDGLDGWDVDDVIAQLCQHSLMWLPSSRTGVPNAGSRVGDMDENGDNEDGRGGGGLGGGSSASAIQAFMSTAPHVVLIAGSDPESAQAAAADLVDQGTACVSILSGGIRNVRSGFPSLITIVSDNL